MPAPRPVTKKPATPQASARQAYKTIPAKTVADDPKGYSKTPHAYGDILITGQKLGSALQRDIVYWIERKTWGDMKRPEYAKISLGTFCKLCGVKERKTVQLALRYLIKAGIIGVRDWKGCGETVARQYKLTPERWKAAPKYEPTAIEDEAVDIAEVEDTDEEDTANEAETAPERIVQPGKVSRPQGITINTKEAPAVVVRVTYHSELDFPVSFRARAGRNGRMQITAAALRSPVNCSHPQPQFTKSSTDSKRFDSFDAAANRIALQAWDKEADQKLIHRIIEAAGNAPVELFEHIARARVRKRDAAKYGPLLLVHIAADAASTHARRQSLAVEHEPGNAYYTPMTPAEIAAAIAELDAIPEKPVSAPRCTGCKGTGKVEHGIAGLFKNCGVCKGSGKRSC